MKVAIIPARGGSKRIPRKNIKDFRGKPMIGYAIAAAENAKIFDMIVVTSEDSEILKISEQLGAYTIVRKECLADDLTPTQPVICDAIEELEGKNFSVNEICCIYPCVPLIDSADLIRSYDRMHGSNASAVLPVSRFPSAPQRAYRINHDGRLAFLYPEFSQVRTQDLTPCYFDIGQYYWGNSEAWFANEISSGIAYPVDPRRVVDIDTAEDWLRAEQLYDILIGKKS